LVVKILRAPFLVVAGFVDGFIHGRWGKTSCFICRHSKGVKAINDRIRPWEAT
jgi:hypothetical protein